MIHAPFKHKGTNIVVDFARFYGGRGADQNSWDRPDTATQMMDQ